MLTTSANRLYGMFKRLPSAKRLPRSRLPRSGRLRPPRLPKSLVRPPRALSGSILPSALVASVTTSTRRASMLATRSPAGDMAGVTAIMLDVSRANPAMAYGRADACMVAPTESGEAKNYLRTNRLSGLLGAACREDLPNVAQRRLSQLATHERFEISQDLAMNLSGLFFDPLTTRANS